MRGLRPTGDLKTELLTRHRKSPRAPCDTLKYQSISTPNRRDGASGSARNCPRVSAWAQTPLPTESSRSRTLPPCGFGRRHSPGATSPRRRGGLDTAAGLPFQGWHARVPGDLGEVSGGCRVLRETSPGGAFGDGSSGSNRTGRICPTTSAVSARAELLGTRDRVNGRPLRNTDTWTLLATCIVGHRSAKTPQCAAGGEEWENQPLANNRLPRGLVRSWNRRAPRLGEDKSARPRSVFQVPTNHLFDSILKSRFWLPAEQPACLADRCPCGRHVHPLDRSPADPGLAT